MSSLHNNTAKSLKFLLLSLVVGLPGVASTEAQTARKETHFTFNRTVELPGDMKLPAGEYTFRLASDTTARRVVQILDKDGKARALLFSIPTTRPEASDKPQLRFMEVAEGQPPAIQVWWYAGERTGYEFVYPKAQAMRLARAARTSVPMTDSAMNTVADMESAEVSRFELDNQGDAPAVRATSGENVPAPTGSMASNEAPRELPRTASPLPLIGLLGFLSVFAAAGLRSIR